MTNGCVGFAELNILHDGDDPAKTVACVAKAIQLGYDAIAVNTDLGNVAADLLDEAESAPPAKKRKKAQMKAIPEPFAVDLKQLDLSPLEAAGKRLRLYSRVTASISDSGMVHHFLHNARVLQYDVVALRPASEALLMTLTNKNENLDMITFDAAVTPPWLYRGKVVQAAAEKGIGFELSYAAALHDRSQRRQVLANGRQLLTATRGGRGVVLSSGASRPLDLRAPFDAANLLTLFGSTAEQGRRCVSANAQTVLLRAESKRTLKGAVHVQRAQSVLPDQLQRLMKVPEFRAEIQSVPAQDSKSES